MGDATYQSLRTKLEDYKTITEIYSKITEEYLNTQTEIADAQKKEDNETDVMNTNHRRVEYEVSAMDTIYDMGTWLNGIYIIVALLFLGKYYTVISTEKSGYTITKMVGMSVILVSIPFILDYVIDLFIYIYKLPNMMYPDATP